VRQFLNTLPAQRSTNAAPSSPVSRRPIGGVK
jgi:hypothetical protein